MNMTQIVPQRNRRIPKPVKDASENYYQVHYWQRAQQLYNERPRLTWRAAKQAIKMSDPSLYKAAFGSSEKERYQAGVMYEIGNGASEVDAFRLAGQRLPTEAKLVRALEKMGRL